MTDLSLTVSRTIKAPIEAAFNAWLDPEMIAQFMTPGEGMSVIDASASPQTGGRFDLTMVAGENHIPHGGVYKTIDPHSKIVFTWESPFSVDGSTVTLNLSETVEGTEIELVHVKFADEEARDNHNGGWTMILATLDRVLA